VQFFARLTAHPFLEGARRSAGALVCAALKPTAEPHLRIRLHGVHLPEDALSMQLMQDNGFFSVILGFDTDRDEAFDPQHSC
jgi:hypothetical protein